MCTNEYPVTIVAEHPIFNGSLNTVELQLRGQLQLQLVANPIPNASIDDLIVQMEIMAEPFSPTMKFHFGKIAHGFHTSVFPSKARDLNMAVRRRDNPVTGAADFLQFVIRFHESNDFDTFRLRLRGYWEKGYIIDEAAMIDFDAGFYPPPIELKKKKK